MNKIFNKIWIFTLFLISCQQQSENNNQTLRLNFQEGDVPTLHPHLLEGRMSGRIIAKALFEGLTRINSKKEAELAGAESVEISTCQTQYTFTLRDNQWSDGTPVTAYQYEKAWKQAINPTSECPRADLFYVIKGAKQGKEGTISLEKVGVKALDDKTLSVTLAFPAPYFLKLIASPIFAPVERTKTEPTRFNGPFLVEKWKKENVLVLQENPYFWDHDRVPLREIQIQMVTDPSTAFLMYEKQQIDWAGHPFCKFSSERVFELQKRKELQKHPADRVLWLYLNTQHPFLASTKIRQALSLSINRSLITEHICPGNLPLYHPLPFSLSLCQKVFSDNNFVQSKQLFEEGLKEIKSSKTTIPPLTLSYPHIAGRKPLVEYLKETWEKTFGIQVHLEEVEWHVFRNSLEKGKFQMGVCVESALYPDPSELLERFDSMKTANFPQWEHPVYQEKLNLAREAPHQRAQFLREAEELLAKQTPFIPICSFDILYTHNPKLKGYVFDHSGCVDFRWAYLED